MTPVNWLLDALSMEMPRPDEINEEPLDTRVWPLDEKTEAAGDPGPEEEALPGD